MTTPLSENQWLAMMGNYDPGTGTIDLTSSISYDSDGLIDADSFELNWNVSFAGNGYDSFIDASDGFEGSMAIYLETYAYESDPSSYYYIYEALNTTDVSDPNYTIEDTDIYKVSYYNNEKTALQDRYAGTYNSFSDQLTAVFETAVLTAVSSSYRSTNRYVFRKVKEPILNTKNVSALVTGSSPATIAITPTVAGATTSY